MPVSKHTIAISDNTEQHRFDTSWHKLVNSGKILVALCEARQWQQAGQMLHLRKKLSAQHFKRFPVGPETRNLYCGSRLATLFAQENHITTLQVEQPGLRSAGPNLFLVK